MWGCRWSRYNRNRLRPFRFSTLVFSAFLAKSKQRWLQQSGRTQSGRIELGGSVWMTVGGESLGGPGRVDLLALIAEHGSITHAAKAMKMSYKAAWDAIDTMNNLAGEPLVERVTGGKGGGGTVLTRRGAQLVENFDLIESEHRRFIAQLSAQAQGIADDFLLIRRISMRTSARNNFAGPVTHVSAAPSTTRSKSRLQAATTSWPSSRTRAPRIWAWM